MSWNHDKGLGEIRDWRLLERPRIQDLPTLSCGKEPTYRYPDTEEFIPPRDDD